MEDGGARAAAVALVAILRSMGVVGMRELAHYASFPIHNTNGEVVGVLEPHGSLR